MIYACQSVVLTLGVGVLPDVPPGEVAHGQRGLAHPGAAGHRDPHTRPRPQPRVAAADLGTSLQVGRHPRRVLPHMPRSTGDCEV